MSAIAELLTLGSPNDTSNSKRLLRDTLVELISTTLFIFSGTLSATSTGMKLIGQGSQSDVARVLPISMVFGISIMFLAYSFGHLSGGHMNPAVSLMMFFRRQISFPKMICYWLAQFTGSMLGAALTWACINNLAGQEVVEGKVFNRPPFNLGSNALDSQLTSGNGFLLEFMGSVVFFTVIAQTALDKKGIASTAFPAIPIGFSLVVVHVCLIPFTGCGVNPARTFGPSVVTCLAGGACQDVTGDWYWIYYVGPFLAAWFVAEMTLLLEMDVGDNDTESLNDNETSKIKKAVEHMQTGTTFDDEMPGAVVLGEP